MITFTMKLGEVITVRERMFRLVHNGKDSLYFLDTVDYQLSKPLFNLATTGYELDLESIQCMLSSMFNLEAEEVKFKGKYPLVEEFKIGDTILIDGSAKYKLVLVATRTFVLLNVEGLWRWSDAIDFGGECGIGLTKDQVERLVNGSRIVMSVAPKQWRKVTE